MKRLRLVLLCGILTLAGSVALAQMEFGGPFGRVRPGILVGHKSVQQELKLTDEQTKKADAAAEKFRNKLGTERSVKRIPEVLKENEKAVAEILKPEQAKRLKQIFYQWQGASIMSSDPELSEALQLDDDQKKEIQKIDREMLAQIRQVFVSRSRTAPVEELIKKHRNLQAAWSEKIVNVLTSEQKAKWKELQGQPFSGDLRFGPTKTR